ncbi:oligosaccharide repeat unit polymerase [Scatolibacter rhodanostii]|uniref:oligosaccharide repeat unit polymerase n=1 Tax=Scatolibacter rhodanostii TaxID=2014781 RepID=UPI000C080BE3|nr:oligosaccharide repeat unit polymerase [Scatolibacter rhodanostii]
MQYFGVPKCPYCGKRVNTIRRWSLKKEGEYKCPRCSGISNIFLSPLVYVLAVLAIFSSVVIYFYYKFIMSSMSWKTMIWVGIPFAIFFLLSLFLPYLEKPVIKRAPVKNKAPRGNVPMRPQSGTLPAIPTNFSEDDYMPRIENQNQPAYLEAQQIRKNDTGILGQTTEFRSSAQLAARKEPIRENQNLQNTAMYSSVRPPVKQEVQQRRPLDVPMGVPTGTIPPKTAAPRTRMGDSFQSPGTVNPGIQPRRPSSPPNSRVNLSRETSQHIASPNTVPKSADLVNAKIAPRKAPEVPPKNVVQNTEKDYFESKNQTNEAFSLNANREKKVEAVEIPKDFFSKNKKDK